MIDSTVGEKVVRAERSQLDLFLAQILKQTPLYLFVQGARAALKSRGR
jgi:hypothetical protein